ncbi:hypothetical protein WUBG_03499 [Wuchereria bancrofti]|uniref:Uncharacterized protein n=1 Tax=Wuchereria bancrofti TaxID=6293 RepID=J9ETV5_WUCBA|nr:hypothetical protein WUBG_03499 [Wuchereria bancrofti]
MARQATVKYFQLSLSEMREFWSNSEGHWGGQCQVHLVKSTAKQRMERLRGTDAYLNCLQRGETAKNQRNYVFMAHSITKRYVLAMAGTYQPRKTKREKMDSIIITNCMKGQRAIQQNLQEIRKKDRRLKQLKLLKSFKNNLWFVTDPETPKLTNLRGEICQEMWSVGIA